MKRYVADRRLPFDILVDDSRSVVKAYGVWHAIGLDAWDIARPALFLIDREGTIRWVRVADHQFEFPGRDDIMAAIDELKED